jgi:hypothetical protein
VTATAVKLGRWWEGEKKQNRQNVGSRKLP